MQYVASGLFVIVGLINVTPVVGVLGPTILHSLYGLPIAEGDLALLMRHRAVLLGLVGGLLIVAAFRQTLRRPATVVGVVSMLSFVLLAFLEPPTTLALKRVLYIDCVAIPLLLVAAWLTRHTRPN